jgi:hypothetical protein
METHMQTQILAALIRHGLQLAAGSLLTQGIVSDGHLELVAGALATLATVGWEIASKRKAAAQ